MGPQESETGSDKFRLLVKLSSHTPVFGCRMFPIVRVSRHQSFLQLEVPPHELTFSWYREQTSSSFDREKVRCSVHLDMLAKMQCEECVKLNLSVKGSYHCSNSCYVDAWEKHKVYHRYAAETVSETLSNNQQEVRNVKSYGPDKYWTESDFVVGSSSDKNEKVMEPDGKIWIKVGSSKSYAPTEHDIGHCLRLECAAVDCSMGTNITPVNITVTDPVIYPPAHPPRSTINCVWKSWNSGLEAHSSSDLTFSVLSYNILAGIYAIGNRYSYCPEWALSWEYRMQNIINEIIEYDADILCLQEVQRDHFEDLLKPALAKYGYSVLYKTKTKEVYTPNQYTIDGCATFYRRDKFKEIVKYELEYDKSGLPFVEALEPELKKVGRFRLLKDNVALVVILERVKNEESFDGNQPKICVANTHIHASEKFPDVKWFQVVSLVNGLGTIANSKIPLLICGDLNSLPLRAFKVQKISDLWLISDLFSSVCAFCDDGGDLLCCEGRCLRSFHPIVESVVGSDCKSLGFTKDEVDATQNYFCKNCKYKQHQCFACGKLGPSDNSSGAEMSDLIRHRKTVTSPHSLPPPTATSAFTAPAQLHKIPAFPNVSHAPVSSESSVVQPVSARRRHRPPHLTDTASTSTVGASDSQSAKKNTRGPCRQLNMAKVTRVTNTRINIRYNERHRAAPMADQHSSLAHDVGSVIRTHCPMKWKSWKAMPDEVQMEVRGQLSMNYNLENLDDDLLAYINRLFAERYKQWKSDLHHHFQAYDDPQVALQEGCPKELEGREDSWEWLCGHFQGADYVKMVKANKGNRAKKTLLHHSGARPFSYRMEARRQGGSKFPEIDVFGDVYVRPGNELAESLHLSSL